MKTIETLIFWNFTSRSKLGGSSSFGTLTMTIQLPQIPFPGMQIKGPYWTFVVPETNVTWMLHEEILIIEKTEIMGRRSASTMMSSLQSNGWKLSGFSINA